MSTRATVHFQKNGKTRAIIYRHYDGYPEGLGEDLEIFLKEVQNQTDDTRFDDPEYLAAKFVVWQASKYTNNPNKPLNFLSVGVLLEDPLDIEFRYTLWCDNRFNTPKITIEDLH